VIFLHHLIFSRNFPQGPCEFSKFHFPAWNSLASWDDDSSWSSRQLKKLLRLILHVTVVQKIGSTIPNFTINGYQWME
jgi:hypothetical protein